jgi:hypothetical protein
MRIATTILMLSTSTILTAQSMCDCGNFKMYRMQQDDVNTYYFNSTDVVKFLTSYGGASPLIYDFDGGGVTVSDLLLVINGYGQQPPELNYCDIVVDFVASSGWPSTYPNAYVAIVKPTVFDETGGTFEDCPLKTWYVEIVYDNGTTKYYYH